jgi:hypothetical protein
MSYSRFGRDGSYVYIFKAIYGGWECCGCILNHEEGGFIAPTREELLEHIKEHRQAGHVVPEYVDERLRQEIAEEQQ